MKAINIRMEIDVTNIKKTLAEIRWDKRKQKEIRSLTSFLKKDASWSERIYCIVNDRQGSGVCTGCGKATKFSGFSKGYNQYCGDQCRNNSQVVKDKRRLTNMNRYGGASPMNSKLVREKARETMDIVYGVENPSQLADVKEKKRETLMKNYGVENPSQSDIIQERKRQTYQEKYNKDHWVQDPKKKKDFIEKLEENRMPCKNVGGNNWICKECDYPFQSKGDNPLCPICTNNTK